ncbi:hypothetical protein E2C01_067819 [Portunus trituberculatus]|uniref:Uncharacterized protein n=1 Tax=Portunus trituberculatus TaxID=210409 RepID=A0A5B7HW60_PORTR|nr:hypothetical protein [Portunus trituberculatus]
MSPITHASKPVYLIATRPAGRYLAIPDDTPRYLVIRTCATTLGYRVCGYPFLRGLARWSRLAKRVRDLRKQKLLLLLLLLLRSRLSLGLDGRNTPEVSEQR